MIAVEQLSGWFLGCLLTGAALAIHEAKGEIIQAPAGQYVVAYDSMKQADWAKTRGMSEEAVELYTEARSLFQKLSADYPFWETNVVAFRIKYCADELAALRRGTAALSGVPDKATQIPPARASLAPSPAAARTGADRSDRQADKTYLAAGLRSGLQKERAGRVKSALETYLTILEEQPQNREALKGAARCYLKLSLPENARALLQKGMQLPNPNAELSLLMALIYCHDREFYKAYQLLLVVLNQQPSSAIAHLAMGVAQAGLDQMADAQRATQKAIQLDPKLGDAYYNLAQISRKLKPARPASARNYYFNALRYGVAPDPELEKQLR